MRAFQKWYLCRCIMLWRLFWTFFKIGGFTFGGGYAMLSLIRHDVVDRRQWLTEQEFVDLFAVSQSLPGVFAVNISIFVGYRLKKKLGAIAAAVGATLPSFLIILLIAMSYREVQSNPWVMRVMLGIRPTVVAMIAIPVVTTWRAMRGTWRMVWLPILSALLVWAVGVSPVWIIVGAAVGGIVYGEMQRRERKERKR